MSSVIGLIQRLYKIYYSPIASKSTQPLKFGILGAAAIGPPALILPARSHPDVVVYAVAARSLHRAQEYAKKWGIEKAYEGYQKLLDDPEVDVVYNALPNSLHYEWTMKALRAGKHVLNEKPTADTAAETRAMFALSEEKGLILLDAYHYKFHPAIKRAKAIVDSGEIGEVKHVSADLLLHQSMFGKDDIRYDFELGGGAMMDLGCYTMSSIRYMASSNPTSVLSTSHIAFVPPSQPTNYIPKVDRRVEATLAFPNDVTGTIRVDLGEPNTFGFIPKIPTVKVTVEGTLGTVEVFNFVGPHLYHSVAVNIKGGHTRVEKVYKDKSGNEGRSAIKGEEWWSTYRYQLEALVDKIRGREPDTWLDKEDSIETMQWIENVYEKTGLGSRPCRI